MKTSSQLKNNIEICEIARELTLEPEYLVGRVIARPFVGEPGNFTRTTNRHDYALKPFNRTVMNELEDLRILMLLRLVKFPIFLMVKELRNPFGQ